jgi:hypothetical protein
MTVQTSSPVSPPLTFSKSDLTTGELHYLRCVRCGRVIDEPAAARDGFGSECHGWADEDPARAARLRASAVAQDKARGLHASAEARWQRLQAARHGPRRHH